MDFRGIAARVLDIVIPPRETEKLVRTLVLDDLRSMSYHDPRVRALVWELKYFAHPKAVALAGALLSEVLLEIASKNPEKYLLIPVPMHAARLRERGHNQTEMLCESVLRNLGKERSGAFEYRKNTLARVKATPQQQGLQKHEREHNLQRSMKVFDNTVRGRTCVVVDDVSTTGATFAEATRALREAGAGQIICVALAYS